jgi:hypothetical protein
VDDRPTGSGKFRGQPQPRNHLPGPNGPRCVEESSDRNTKGISLKLIPDSNLSGYETEKTFRGNSRTVAKGIYQQRESNCVSAGSIYGIENERPNNTLRAQPTLLWILYLRKDSTNKVNMELLSQP